MGKSETENPGGKLLLVATPIGNARDITLRALDYLREADLLAAEDTRSLRRLMDIHGVPLAGRRILAYHDHSRADVVSRMIGEMRAGKSLLYASEAGTPLVADPGYALVNAAREAGIEVVAAPGPSAVITALSVAGLPTDRFLFAGFLPAAAAARKRALAELAAVPATLVFYEAPHRVAAALRDCAEVLGPDRQAALCRELTKRFEEVRRASLGELAEDARSAPPRGEIVLIIDRGHSESVKEVDLESELRAALAAHSVKDAAEVVARAHGLRRRDVYQAALKLAKENRG